MYDSLGIYSNASVDECDIVSTVAGFTIIVNLGVDDGKNVANTVDLVNGVMVQRRRRITKRRRRRK
jgi:hypothetical protein